ncbi:hypothetical protein AC578_1645 [Pseudocercospora eumusae]|uniref:Uncharacterized protein n=1 Tax=Pseudocercospora eumusae TaxID=321146 RepID=A0A139HM98_9PEZI|nr:hypothetical protein AC578_1645 [Pseudocercospora eumusae]
MSVRIPDHWPEHGVPLYFFNGSVRPIRKNTAFLKPRIAAIRAEWKSMNLETLYPRVREMTDRLYPNDRRRSTQVFATFIAAETIRRDGRQPNQSRRHDPSYRAGSSHPSTPKKQTKSSGQLPTPEATPGPAQNIDALDSPIRDSPLAQRPNMRTFTPEATPAPAFAPTVSTMPTNASNTTLGNAPDTSQLRSARNTMSPAMAAKIAQFETDTRITLGELRRELLEEEDYTEAEADGLLQGVVDGLVDQSDADEVS